MTKKQKGMLWQYYHSNDTQLDDCYGHWSTAKSRAYDWCENKRIALHGYSERIPSHNTKQFTYAFMFDVVNAETGVIETWLDYETACNCYQFKIDDSPVAYDDLWKYL